jgi:actin-related protein 8
MIFHFTVKIKILLVFIQVGDECIVAPLSLFQPELFGVTGSKLVHIQQRASGDPEDPHDENYLRETSVSCGIVKFFHFT